MLVTLASPAPSGLSHYRDIVSSVQGLKNVTSLLMAWLITFSPFLYILGAIAFWLFHKSESLKRDFLLGLAWPIAVPVIVPLSIGRRVGAVLKERRARPVLEQAKRESELRAQEQRFSGYAAQDTPRWMADEVSEVQDETRRD